MNQKRRLLGEMVIFAVIAAMVAPVPAFMLTLFIFPFLNTLLDSNSLVLINWALTWGVLMVVKYRRSWRYRLQELARYSGR